MPIAGEFGGSPRTTRQAGLKPQKRPTGGTGLSRVLGKWSHILVEQVLGK